MKNSIKASILLAMLIGFILGLIKVYIDIPSLDEQITHLSIDENSNLYVVLNTGTDEQVIKLDSNQRIVYMHSLKKVQNNSARKVEDLKVDSKDNIYLLITSKHIQTQVLSQEILYLDTKSIIGKEQIAAKLEEPNVLYQHFNERSKNIGSSVEVIGYHNEDQEIVVDQIDFTPDQEIQFRKQNNASYAYSKELGIHKFFRAGETLGCISMAGELYKANDGKMVKLSVKGINAVEQVVSYVAIDTQDNVYVGEQKSGNLLHLDLSKDIAFLKNRAGENITKSSQLTYKDVYHLAINKENNFAVAVKNKDTTQIVSVNQDKSIIYNKLNIGLDNVLRLGVKHFILYFFMTLGVIILGLVLMFWLSQSKRVLYKLIFVTVPIISVILIGMGALVYNIYSKEITTVYLSSIESNARLTEKQISLEAIEKITDHTSYKSSDYKNLENQLEQGNIQNRLLRVKDQNIYVLVDQQYPSFYKLDNFIKLKDMALYEAALETKEMQQGMITDTWGNYLISVIPVIKGNEVVALIDTSTSQQLINEKSKVFFNRLILFISLVIFIIVSLLVLIFRKILMPLQEIEKILKKIKENKAIAKIPYRSQDEFFTISQTINNMTEDIQVQIYNLRNLSEKYFRFVPKKLFFLFNKKNISDLELGDRAKINASIAITAIQYEKQKTFWEKVILEQINKNFSIINEKINEYDGILAGSNRALSEFTVIYPNDLNRVIEALLVTTDQLRVANKGTTNSFLTLLDKTEIELGIGGDDTRLSVVILSKRMEKLYENLEMMKQMGCQVILTEEAYKKIENTDAYEFRYIGYIRQDEYLTINLYDFFQADLQATRKAKQDTKDLFKEALNSFYERDYYKAKNLFSLVLRNHKEDEIARWYVFRCAYLYQHGTAQDDLNIVPYLK